MLSLTARINYNVNLSLNFLATGSNTYEPLMVVKTASYGTWDGAPGREYLEKE